MNTLKVLLADSPDKAPTYRAPEFKGATLTTAQVVGRGTVCGKPTVDLIFEDEKGQKYVTMITGGILENLLGAVRGMQQRTDEQQRRN